VSGAAILETKRPRNDARPGKLIKAYDIRGTVPDQLDADLACQIGAAFARWAHTPSIVLVRDMRPVWSRRYDAT